MSVFHSFVYGDIIGRNGESVAYIQNGSNILRRFRMPVDPRTPKQIAQRATFKFIQRAISPFRPVLFFVNGTKKPQAVGSFFSLVYNEALTGTLPTLSIDWSKVVLSKGMVTLPYTTTLTVLANNTLHFEWETEERFKALPDDWVHVVIYNENSPALNFYNAKAARSNGNAEIVLPDNQDVASLKYWLFFSTADLSEFSPSVYVTPEIVP